MRAFNQSGKCRVQVAGPPIADFLKANDPACSAMVDPAVRQARLAGASPSVWGCALLGSYPYLLGPEVHY
jgi:hypothetical protein